MMEAVAPEDLSLIEKFKREAARFSAAYKKLLNLNASDIPEAYRDEYNSLMNKAQSIGSSIKWITSTIDTVVSTVSNTFSFDGVGYVKERFNSNDGQLGFLPLLPIAAITGAIALMSKFASDIYTFERKIQEQKRLEALGHTPEKAAEIVDKTVGSSTIKDLTALAKPVGVALFIFFGWRVYNNWGK